MPLCGFFFSPQHLLKIAPGFWSRSRNRQRVALVYKRQRQWKKTWTSPQYIFPTTVWKLIVGFSPLSVLYALPPHHHFPSSPQPQLSSPPITTKGVPVWVSSNISCACGRESGGGSCLYFMHAWVYFVSPAIFILTGGGGGRGRGEGNILVCLTNLVHARNPDTGNSCRKGNHPVGKSLNQ